MSVTTKQDLNSFSGQDFFLNAVYVSDTPMTLKQDQGHQTWHEIIDCQQGFDNAQFGKPRLTASIKQSTTKFCQIKEHVNFLYLLIM